jgi:hypothetical protein
MIKIERGIISNSDMTEHDLIAVQRRLVKYIIEGSTSNYGLCDSVLGGDFDQNVVAAWAGDRCPTFPIEGNWEVYHKNKRKHDRRTTYGKKRLELAKFCLQWVELHLAKVS